MPRPIFLRTVLGAGVWLLLLFAPTLTVIPRVLLLAILVVVPLALGLIDEESVALAKRSYIFFYAIAATLAVVSFLLPAGTLAGSLALGWLLFTAFMAWLTLQHLRTHLFASHLRGDSR